MGRVVEGIPQERNERLFKRRGTVEEEIDFVFL